MSLIIDCYYYGNRVSFLVEVQNNITFLFSYNCLQTDVEILELRNGVTHQFFLTISISRHILTIPLLTEWALFTWAFQI